MEKFWIYFWGSLVTWYPYYAAGYLNVFISHTEVMKLLGLAADLFYVHEGAVNTYAMQFTVPVPSNVSSLEFSWQSLTTYPLPYVISIEYETDQEALTAPELSIPPKGYVPQTAETFAVHLICTGNITDQVAVQIHIYVKGPPRMNDTRLAFKRNKRCEKDERPAPNQSLAPAQAPSQGPALLGAAACAMGLVLVVGLIASAMYARARKQIRQDSLHTSFTTAAYGSHQNVFIRLDPLGRPPSANSGSYATIASLNKFPLTESKKSWFRGSPTPSPYATALLPTGDQIAETIYAKPESICPSRISYYASSQLTQNFFCCASLETGGVVLGWYGAVKSILLIVFGTVFLCQGYHVKYGEELADYITALVSFLIAVCLVNLGTCIMLIIGTANRKHVLLLPWLITNMFAIISLTVVQLANFSPSAIVGFLFVGLNIYLWMCVLALYQHLRSADYISKNVRYVGELGPPAYERQIN